MTITLTWEEPPANANRYQFILVPHNQDTPLILGADADPSDGVNIEWTVPEDLAASLRGVAHFADGQVVSSNGVRYVYSGKSPPERVCSLSSATIGPLDLFREPTLTSESFAYLMPGPYAQVLERTTDGWYRIDATVAVKPENGQPAAGAGWVSGQAGVHLHGSCDDIPMGEP